MTQKCVEKPDDIVFLMGIPLLRVPAKFVPIIYGVVYILLANTSFIPLDALIAIGLGFVSKYTDPHYFEILNEAKINELEQKPKLATVKNHPRFISISQNLSANLMANNSLPDPPMGMNNSDSSVALGGDDKDRNIHLGNVEQDSSNVATYPSFNYEPENYQKTGKNDIEDLERNTGAY